MAASVWRFYASVRDDGMHWKVASYAVNVDLRCSLLGVVVEA